MCICLCVYTYNIQSAKNVYTFYTHVKKEKNTALKL